MQVAVWQQSATLHVRLDSCELSQQAADNRFLPEQERIFAAKMNPLQVSVELDGLQISVWDDERDRLLGVAPPGTGKSSKNQILHPATREAFCLSIDGLTLMLQKCEQDGETSKPLLLSCMRPDWELYYMHVCQLRSCASCAVFYNACLLQ